MLYKLIIKPILFRKDAESAHEFTLSVMERASRFSALRARKAIAAPALNCSVGGVEFPNPVGLGAGCDKNGTAIPMWPHCGFGFIEVGTITAQPQPGNEKPRVFRYPEIEGVVNRFGFNSDGSERVAARIQAVRSNGTRLPIPLAINIGKTKVVTEEAAVLEDYRTSYRRLAPYADMVVINVSSPNTPGLRQWQEKGPLTSLLRAVMTEAKATPCISGKQAPVWVKISPDMADDDMCAVVDAVGEQGLTGIIATNTTIGRVGRASHITETGGLSGQPLTERSCEVMRFLYRQTGGKIPLIGVGGIASAEQAYARIRAGASLVQVYTGMIYEGPSLARTINSGLLHLLKRDGLNSINEAVGKDA
jgi:dihydroorotate dehydrogenase